MLKEIVEFSSELKENNIYKVLENNDSEDSPQIINVTFYRSKKNKIENHIAGLVSNKHQRAKDIYCLYKKYTRPFAKENNKTLGGSKGLDTASFFAFRYQWTIPDSKKKTI